MPWCVAFDGTTRALVRLMVFDAVGSVRTRHARRTLASSLLAVLPAALFALGAPACSSGAPSPAPVEERTGSSAEALTGDDAVARVEPWVLHQVHYCQAPNGARDYDSACSTYCNRYSNPAWDPYRSDCSGFLSYAWGLPAPGRVTGQFSPFQNDITHAIPASELRAGDAVNNSEHVMLFKAWVTPGSRATFLEEPGCSSATPYAHELTSDVSINGDSIHVSWNGMTFTAIRLNAIQPPAPPTPPNAPPKGYLDGAKCAALTGWAQDPDAPTAPLHVNVTFDAAEGKAGAIGPLEVTANVHRADLCSALGSCDHGFTLPLPRGLADGKAHAVFAFASDDSVHGVSTQLTDAPKSITCAPPAIPLSPVAGIKRWVASAKVLTAWKMDMLLDVAREPKAEVDAYSKGPDFPAAPIAVVADDGSPEVWVVDGTLRRHVVDPTSLAAWHLAVAKWPAAKVNALVKGQDWPKASFVFQGEGAPEVYVLDVAPIVAAPPGSGGGTTGGANGAGPTGGGDGAQDGASGDAAASGSSGGCAVVSRRGGGSGGDAMSAALAALGLVLAGARRKKRA